jgi:ATP-binding cassette subfamily B protein
MSETNKPNAKALRLYASYWRYTPLYAALSFGFSLARAARGIVPPLLAAIILDQYIDTGIINTGLLIVTSIFMVAIVVVVYLLDIYGIARLHYSVEKRLYQDCFDYLVRQDYSFFADRFSGSIITQASRFAKTYTTFNDTVFFNLLPQLVMVIVAVAIMLYYNPLIGGAVFIIWLLSIWLVIKFTLGRLPLRRDAVAKESEQVGELADVVTNAITVKTFAAETPETKRYGAINTERGSRFMRSWRVAIRNVGILDTLCALLQIIVIVGGMVALKNQTMSVATFLLFQVYILRVIDSVISSGMMARQLEAVSGDAQEMTELLSQPPLVQDKPFAETVKITNGDIGFRDVTFQYGDANRKRPLFEHFNLDIPAGQKIGLVGPSGGGKTTITRLILRFMDIQDGSITVDGHDLRAIKQHDLRSAIAYVPQEPLLFHRSIKDNIRYGKPDASDKEVIAVAKKAYAHDFIAELPQGYDTLVGERGVKLSGGQRQRVAIARAMLTDAPILILDEATSALDSQSERLIQKALAELMKGKTAVVIAHRLSTIQRLDRIVVLDDGKVAEDGSHQELLANNKLYAKLWSHQSGGFIEE